MSQRSSWFAVLSILAVGTACSSAGELEPAESLEGDTATSMSEDALTSATYYVVTRRDVRRCAAPYCGGFFVRSANLPTTTCADGTQQAECYVARLNLADIEVNEAEQRRIEAEAGVGRVVVAGDLRPAPATPQVGVLRVVEAWVALGTTRQPSGALFFVRDNGTRCVAAPCPSFDWMRLNTQQRGTFARVELARTGASEETLRPAQLALASEGILAVGAPRPTTGPAGTATYLDAEQVYTRVGEAADGRACGGQSGRTCGPTELCDARRPGACRQPNPRGTCRAVQQICTLDYNPVCGCDGRTYPNDCARVNSRVLLAHDGECAAPPGRFDGSCRAVLETLWGADIQSFYGVSRSELNEARAVEGARAAALSQCADARGRRVWLRCVVDEGQCRARSAP